MNNTGPLSPDRDVLAAVLEERFGPARGLAREQRSKPRPRPQPAPAVDSDVEIARRRRILNRALQPYRTEPQAPRGWYRAA